MQVTSVCRPIPHTLPPTVPLLPLGRQAVSLSVPVPLPVPDLCTRPSLTPTTHSPPVHRRTPLFVCRHQHQLRTFCCCLFVCLFVQDTSTLLFRFSVCVCVCVCGCLFFQFPFFGFPFHIGHSATCFALQLQLLVAPRAQHAPALPV